MPSKLYALYIVVIVIRSAKFLGDLRNGEDLLLYFSRLWSNQILVAGDGNYFDKWRCSLKPHLYNNEHFRFPLARGIPTFRRAQQAAGLTRLCVEYFTNSCWIETVITVRLNFKLQRPTEIKIKKKIYTSTCRL